MLNRIIIMGRITADLTVKQTNSGKEYLRFSVAVEQPAKDGEIKADFFRCTAWGKTALFIDKYFGKGAMILIEGSIHNDNYTDDNGIRHYGMNIHVENASFTGEHSTACLTTTIQACSQRKNAQFIKKLPVIKT